MLLKPQFFQNYENFLGKACHFITVLLSFSFQKNLEAKQTNKKKKKNNTNARQKQRAEIYQDLFEHAQKHFKL